MMQAKNNCVRKIDLNSAMETDEHTTSSQIISFTKKSQLQQSLSHDDKEEDEKTIPSMKKMHETYHHMPQKKHVSFNGLVRALPTIHVSDYSPSELEATWFQRKEMDEILEDVFRIVNEMEESTHCDDNDDDAREELHQDKDETEESMNEEHQTKNHEQEGLEFLTTWGAKRRTENRQAVLHAVLMDQFLQTQSSDPCLYY